MSHLPKILNSLRKLLSYPEQHTLQTAELLYVLLMEELPEAAGDAAAFGSFVEQHGEAEVEEAFTRTFDVNPTCALEVGWHLFGEEYARGMFLVRMREELRKHDIPESVELPDHLCHVLAVVAAMPADEAARFVRACVQPAVEKMNGALAGQGSPYERVVACLVRVLRHAWGDPEETPGEGASAATSGPATSRSPAFASDPLRDFPVADVTSCEACSCGESLGLVPLTMRAAAPADSDAASAASSPPSSARES